MRKPAQTSLVVTVMLAVALALPTGALAQVSFSDGGDHPTGGTGPLAVAAGDFNGDSDPDLAVAHDVSGNVSVLMGQADGDFAAAPNSPFAAGESPWWIAVGDLNDDSDPDLAVPNAGSDNASVLFGEAGDGFAAATNLPAGDQPNGAAIGDFNGDTHNDLAIANFASDDVSVLLSDGKGGFSAATGSPFAAGDGPIELEVGHFNGDAHADLAVTNLVSDRVSVLLGAGDGSFGVPTAYAAGDGPDSVAVGDFDDDSDSDLAVSNSDSGDVSVLLGDGDGDYGAPTDYKTGTNPWWVDVGDFDGDADPDLAVANHDSGDVSVLLGQADGTFTEPTDFTAHDGPAAVAIGDFDGDSDDDLAVANYESNDVSVLLNNRLPAAASLPADPPPAGGTTPPPADTAPAPNTSAGPAISWLRLGSRCVRPSRSGRVRIAMTMRMARTLPVQVRIDRAVRARASGVCSTAGAHTSRYRKVAILRHLSTRPAAAGRRRLTLKRRLAPGLYRITVRAHLGEGRLSAPVRRYLRVGG
jgi:hypothetical protein